MVKNTKAKGRRNELKTVALLESLGFEVIVSAASLGAWDVIAWDAHEILFVQVKSNAWPGSVEMEKMRLCPAPPNGRKIVHRWDDYATTVKVMPV